MVLRRAAGFLSNLPEKMGFNDGGIAVKKRRHSSNTSNDIAEEKLFLSPPIIKKRRIQGRKPIERMRDDA